MQTSGVHFKREQPQVLSLDSHETTGTIQQTQDAASNQPAWSISTQYLERGFITVILKFMEIHWKNLALSPRNLI